MKDALGHGSEGNNGTHAAQINNLPTKGAPIMSDATWHASMPPDQFSGGVRDLLGLWSGSQKPEPLSAEENKQVSDAYAKRGDWRAVARSIQDQRRGQK